MSIGRTAGVETVADSPATTPGGRRGPGMSSLATLLLGMGKAVGGSDAGGGTTLDRLGGRGVRVHRGHAVEHLDGADLVIDRPRSHPTTPSWSRRGGAACG